MRYVAGKKETRRQEVGLHLIARLDSYKQSFSTAISMGTRCYFYSLNLAKISKLYSYYDGQIINHCLVNWEAREVSNYNSN